MTSRRVVTLAAVSFSIACSSSGAPQPGASASTSTTVTSATAAPSGTTTATPPRSGASARPPGPITFHHFASATPPPASTACPPIPRGDGPPAALAMRLRRLGCEPALFYKPIDALKKELGLAPNEGLEFNGPSSVTISFTPMPGADLAKALGELPMTAARSKAGAWGFRNWFMVQHATADGLEKWGPGRIRVGVKVDDPGMDVDTVPVGASMTRGDATVWMPESVLPLKDDEVAADHLFAGLVQIASNERQLDDEPADVAKAAGLDDERFRVSRRAIGTGPSAIKGIDVWPARTRIGAAPIIEKLGLQGQIEHLRATDTDDYVLYAGGDEEHAWRGLEVVLRFRPRADGKDAGPADYVLSGVTLMP